jgi:hypothetical protein
MFFPSPGIFARPLGERCPESEKTFGNNSTGATPKHKLGGENSLGMKSNTPKQTNVWGWHPNIHRVGTNRPLKNYFRFLPQNRRLLITQYIELIGNNNTTYCIGSSP